MAEKSEKLNNSIGLPLERSTVAFNPFSTSEQLHIVDIVTKVKVSSDALGDDGKTEVGQVLTALCQFSACVRRALWLDLSPHRHRRSVLISSVYIHILASNAFHEHHCSLGSCCYSVLH